MNFKNSEMFCYERESAMLTPKRDRQFQTLPQNTEDPHFQLLMFLSNMLSTAHSLTLELSSTFQNSPPIHWQSTSVSKVLFSTQQCVAQSHIGQIPCFSSKLSSKCNLQLLSPGKKKKRYFWPLL